VTQDSGAKETWSKTGCPFPACGQRPTRARRWNEGPTVVPSAWTRITFFSANLHLASNLPGYSKQERQMSPSKRLNTWPNPTLPAPSKAGDTMARPEMSDHMPTAPALSYCSQSSRPAAMSKKVASRSTWRERFRDFGSRSRCRCWRGWE